MELQTIRNTLVPIVGLTAKNQRMFIVELLKAHQSNLTFAQWILLNRLQEEDGTNQNDLAIITDRNKASLTRLINTLEKKHLVARIPSAEDKRANKIFLTKKGKQVFDKTIPIIKKAFKTMRHGISAKEEEIAKNILQKIQNNIKNYEK